MALDALVDWGVGGHAGCLHTVDCDAKFGSHAIACMGLGAWGSGFFSDVNIVAPSEKPCYRYILKLHPERNKLNQLCKCISGMIAMQENQWIR